MKEDLESIIKTPDIDAKGHVCQECLYWGTDTENCKNCVVISQRNGRVFTKWKYKCLNLADCSQCKFYKSKECKVFSFRRKK